MAEMVLVQGGDPEMDAGTREARRTFRYFWREVAWEGRRIIPGLALAIVKAPFFDREPPEQAGIRGLVRRMLGSGRPIRVPSPGTEHMWMADVRTNGREIRGRLVNKPNHVRGWRKNDMVTLPIGEIDDWIYVQGEQAYGGFTIQVLRERMAADERAAHDDAWGCEFPDPPTVRLVPAWGAADPDVEHPLSENITPRWEEGIPTADRNFLFAQDGSGWTLLHHQALAGSFATVDLLLRHGADPNLRTHAGETPLALARAFGWSKVEARLVAAGAND